MEDKLDRLIELNERIVNQNDAIIDLLKKLTGEDEEIIEENEDELIFESKLNSGEVLFVANSPDNQIDIYKLTVKKSDELKVSPPEIIDEIEYDFDDNNYEITLDNLTPEEKIRLLSQIQIDKKYEQYLSELDSKYGMIAYSGKSI